MRHQASRSVGWRTLGGVVFASILAAVPGGVHAQGPDAVRPVAPGGARSRPGLAMGSTISDVTTPPPLEGAELPRVRLYSPSGTGTEQMRAAMAADVSRMVHVAGRAVYHPRPAMTVLDLEARVRAGTGAALSLQMVSLHHLPGRRLPLQYRGRELRLGVGIRISVK